ncbi:MAG TPA: MATE family efflux transporter [Methylothermaceae bacterium]|nr:MATE family efflux transporter [Methylothermaceae bacterium]
MSVPLLGMVDTAVMGRLDHPAFIGAIALGGVIFSFLYWGFGFLRMGTSGLTAQALGGERYGEIRLVLARAIVLALLLAALLILLRQPIADLAFQWIHASQSAESLAYRYYEIRIFSAPATLLNYVLIGWFIGLQNTKIPLFLTVLANLTNIVLDIVFVLHWQWQVAGVAAASVTAEYSSLLCGLVFAARKLRYFPTAFDWRQLISWAGFRPLIAINFNLFIRTLLLIFSFAFFTAQSARLGDVILAANTVLLNFQSLMAYVLDGFAHACEALVGKFHGAGNVRKLRQTVIAAAQWSLGGAILFCIAYIFAGDRLIALMTTQMAVRETAKSYQLFVALLPLISVWSFLFDGVFVGLTRAREMRNAIFLSVLLGYLPVWWWLRDLGNDGLWIAFTTFMTLRSLLMGLYWKKMLKDWNW